MTTANSSAKNASSTVAGNSVANSCATLSCVVSDVPRSPRSTWPTYDRYWTGSGRSRPNSCSRRERRAGSIPRSPEIFSTGSPGIRWISANASSVTPRNVGTTSARRLSRKASIAGACGSRCESDVVEEVMRRRIHPVAPHFLAQRVEAHRMRDRYPRRLVLDDRLRLLVELRTIGLVRPLRCLDDQVFERLVAPARDIPSALHRFATEERNEEVVGIAIVARPAEHHRRLLACLAALAILGPLVSDELRVHADLFPVRLDQ